MFEAPPSSVPSPIGAFSPSLAITDGGLVCGLGSTLVRMADAGAHGTRLSLEDDTGRLVAMLSAAFGRRVPAAEVVPHVQAAAAFWARGDKATANFRLMFARLPRLRDHVDAGRLRLAEYALDEGLSPDALMRELGYSSPAADLQKYREDAPRGPAGFGEQSGRWTDDPSFADAPIRVAKELPEEDEKTFEERRLTGATTRQEDIEHGRGGVLDTPGLPRGIGPGPYAGEPIPAGPSPTNPTAAKQRQVTAQGYKDGCHICGTMDPGTASGNYVCDHQYPTCLVAPGTMQFYLPSCLKCSQRQGGLVRAYKFRGNNNE